MHSDKSIFLVLVRLQYSRGGSCGLEALIQTLYIPPYNLVYMVHVLFDTLISALRLVLFSRSLESFDVLGCFEDMGSRKVYLRSPSIL